MHRGAKHADLDFLATSALPVLGVQRRREGCRGVHGGVFLAHHALHKRFVFRLQDSRFKIQDLKIQDSRFKIQDPRFGKEFCGLPPSRAQRIPSE